MKTYFYCFSLAISKQLSISIGHSSFLLDVRNSVIALNESQRFYSASHIVIPLALYQTTKLLLIFVHNISNRFIHSNHIRIRLSFVLIAYSCNVSFGSNTLIQCSYSAMYHCVCRHIAYMLLYW